MSIKEVVKAQFIMPLAKEDLGPFPEVCNFSLALF
jgi:hypothetical protein